MATSGCSAGNSARFALLFRLPLGPHGIELDVVVHSGSRQEKSRGEPEEMKSKKEEGRG
jgi:hypothetical protein